MGLLEGGAFPGVVGAVVVVVVPDEVAVDEPGDRDGAELDEAKEEEQVKAGFLAVGRGGSHRWEMAGLVMNEVGKLSPCHIVLLNVFQVGPWYGDLRLSWSNSHTTQEVKIDCANRSSTCLFYFPF